MTIEINKELIEVSSIRIIISNDDKSDLNLYTRDDGLCVSGLHKSINILPKADNSILINLRNE